MTTAVTIIIKLIIVIFVLLTALASINGVIYYQRYQDWC